MSLFNRPAWAKSRATEDEDEDTNIFSHSNRFKAILAEDQRKSEKLARRKAAKAERRSSGKHRREMDDSDDSLLKKRRITLEDGEALLSSVGLSADIASGAGDDADGSEDEVTQPIRRSPRRNKHGRRDSHEQELKGSGAASAVVEINDGSDDDGLVVTRVQAIEQEDEDDESDEELAELRQRARLQRKQKEQLNNRKSGGSDPAAHTRRSDAGAEDPRYKRPPTPPEEPVIHLLISSRIPNTAQLIVQRKLSQRLEEVRKAWCKKQGFPEHTWADIFFIHKTRRLYDVTTCKSLGLEVDAFGNVTMKGAEGKEGVDKVHLEAVTESIFREITAERDLEAKRRSGELPPEGQANAGAADDEVSKEESTIRLTLIAKDGEDFRLKVKPTTLFSRVAAAYCKSRLTDGQTVRLLFDGDPLDPKDEVQNTEISDLDIVEVHLT